MRLAILTTITAGAVLAGACSSDFDWKRLTESTASDANAINAGADTGPWADGLGPDVFLNPPGQGGTRPNRR